MKTLLLLVLLSLAIPARADTPPAPDESEPTIVDHYDPPPPNDPPPAFWPSWIFWNLVLPAL